MTRRVPTARARLEARGTPETAARVVALDGNLALLHMETGNFVAAEPICRLRVLEYARELGLLLESGVPKDHRKEYGDDTVWPTAVVVDRNGVIRYTELSKFIADRPNPEKLVAELRTAQSD